MSLQYTTRPISDRSPFTGDHRHSQFKVSWSQALDLLQREYEFLGGRHLVIEVDVREDQIRSDGMIRSDAQAMTPAVRVAFDSIHGSITMATDAFVRGYGSRMQPHWQHNAYAIAKSLEALRMMDRYGITRRGEQYQGWKAIGSGALAVGAGMTHEEALALIVGFAETSGPIDDVIRAARANTHPDRHDGQRDAWDQVEAAVKVLEAAS